MANLNQLQELLTKKREELAQVKTDSFDIEAFEKQSQLERDIEKLEALEQLEIKREALDSQISTAESNLSSVQSRVDEKEELKPKFDKAKAKFESSVKAMFKELEAVREIDPNFKLPTGYMAQFATSDDRASNFKTSEWSHGGEVSLPNEIEYTDRERKHRDEAKQILESLKTERASLR
jgi:SMC interacting uncharacterized protein involved in chromosome segregation